MREKENGAKKKLAMVKMVSPIPKSSNFLILVNSNQTEDSLKKKKIDVDRFSTNFMKTIIKECKNKENYKFQSDDTLTLDDIYEIKLDEAEKEIGDKLGMIHAHITSLVRYKNIGSGFIHVDIKKLKAAILEQLPLTNIQVKVEFIKPVYQRASNYVVKDKFNNGREFNGGGGDEEPQDIQPKKKRKGRISKQPPEYQGFILQ